MKKQIAQVGLVASLVLAGITAAHAGTPATVTVTGSVDSTSCNLDVNGAAKENLPLGGWVASQFAAGTGVLSSLKVVDASKQPIVLNLSGCAGKGDGDTLKVEVTGNTLTANSDIFNQDTAGTAGVALTVTPTGGQEALVEDKGSYTAYTYAAGTAVGTADNQSITFHAYMASPDATPATQKVTAPINFTVVNS